MKQTNLSLPIAAAAAEIKSNSSSYIYICQYDVSTFVQSSPARTWARDTLRMVGPRATDCWSVHLSHA